MGVCTPHLACLRTVPFSDSRERSAYSTHAKLHSPKCMGVSQQCVVAHLLENSSSLLQAVLQRERDILLATQGFAQR